MFKKTKRMLDQVLEQLVSKAADFCANEENRALLESKFIGPVMEYLALKFSWIAVMIRAVAVLVVVQTVLLVWLLLRSYKLHMS